MFDVFDASFIPSIVDENSYILRTSNGFYYNKIDGLFLRNSNQYILVFIALVVIYVVLKFLEKVFIKPNPSIAPEQSKQQNKIFHHQQIIKNGQQIQKQNKNSLSGNQKKKIEAKENLNNQASQISGKEKCKLFLTKAVGFFEWGIFLGCLEAAYLNITTFTFLQLQNAGISVGVEYVSFFLSFIVLTVLIGFLITIYAIIQRIVQIHKQRGLFFLNENSNFQVIITTWEEEQTRQQQAKANDDFQNSFAMVYSLFVPGQILQQGYYLIVAARKFVFSFFLVFAYEVPGLILSVWIILNIIMIAILIKYKPYKKFIFTARDIVSEACFIIIHCLTYPFLSSDFVYGVSHQDDYQGLGRAIVAFSLIIIFIHLICLIYEAIMTLIEFFKPKEEIPPTPVIPTTPNPSPMPKEPIILTEYQKLKLGLRKQKKYIKLEEIHKENFSQEINRQYFDKLQQLEDMMAQTNDENEFEILKKQYDQQVFLLNLSNRLFEYVRENPSATIISQADVESLVPTQLNNQKKNDANILQQSEQQQQNQIFQQDVVQTDVNNKTYYSQQQRQKQISSNQDGNYYFRNQNLELSKSNQNQSQTEQNNNAKQIESENNNCKQVKSSAVENQQIQDVNPNANEYITSQIKQETKLNNVQNQEQSQQVSQIQENNLNTQKQYSQNQQSIVQDHQLGQSSNQQKQFTVQIKQSQNQNSNHRQLQEIEEQDDFMYYDSSFYNQSTKYQQSKNDVHSPKKQQIAQLNTQKILNEQNQTEESQYPKKRKYQRQINPINASRVENINNALKKVNYQ
ncbi:hypothetical protein ABPG72_015701 [Tetrahymena utriculariae]